MLLQSTVYFFEELDFALEDSLLPHLTGGRFVSYLTCSHTLTPPRLMLVAMQDSVLDPCLWVISSLWETYPIIVKSDWSRSSAGLVHKYFYFENSILKSIPSLLLIV